MYKYLQIVINTYFEVSEQTEKRTYILPAKLVAGNPL